MLFINIQEIRKARLTFFVLICLALTGCGNNQKTEEPTIVNSSESPETGAYTDDRNNVYICSDEEDKAAADYLRRQYNLPVNESVPKVILDCDMTYSGDDSMCMCILAQADSIGLIELLGVTITGGNTFVAVGANSALKQLELIGREDIPLYMGTDVPLNGFRDLEEQEKIVGSIDRWGAMYNIDRYVEPGQYHDLGANYERKWGYSQTEPQQQNSADFMIEQVAKYPGEVTVISVGAATNIAMACRQDESFASNTAGIIYMGTIIDGPGTYTPYADFNVFYDAEAFSICLNSDFPAQTIVPHDAAESGMLDKAVFDLMDAKGSTPISKMWLDDQYSLYRRTTTRKMGCTDAIAAAVLLNPAVVQEKEDLYVAINTDVSDAKYGEAAAWKSEEADLGAVPATFILSVDTDLYWDFVTDLICHMQSEPPYTYSYFVESNGLLNSITIGQQTEIDSQSAQTSVAAETIADYSEYFQGISGCAVIYNESADTYFFYMKDKCEIEVSPLSTFKIVSALAGLENNVLVDEKTTMEYSGVKYPVDAWNADLSLREAFEASCVWYFRQVIDMVGQENIRAILKDIQYGNCDISEWNGSGVNPLPELNGFWLESSLKISPKQQVAALNYIFGRENNFAVENLEELKNIMYITELDNGCLYGKTGSGADGKAWFVGFIEESGNKTYFAVYLDDMQNKDMVSGNKAKEITISIKNDVY